MKIFFDYFIWFQFSFGPKTHLISGKGFFFFLVLTYFCTKNPLNFRRRPFFVLHLLLDIIFIKVATSQRVTPRNPAPGATILSNASAQTLTQNLILLTLEKGNEKCADEHFYFCFILFNLKFSGEIVTPEKKIS